MQCLQQRICDVVHGWMWVGNNLNPQSVWCRGRLQTTCVIKLARNKGDRITCPCFDRSCVRPKHDVNSTKCQQFAYSGKLWANNRNLTKYQNTFCNAVTSSSSFKYLIYFLQITSCDLCERQWVTNAMSWIARECKPLTVKFEFTLTLQRRPVHIGLVYELIDRT